MIFMKKLIFANSFFLFITILLFVVLISCLLMAWGLISYKKTSLEEGFSNDESTKKDPFEEPPSESDITITEENANDKND